MTKRLVFVIVANPEAIGFEEKSPLAFREMPIGQIALESITGRNSSNTLFMFSAEYPDILLRALNNPI